MIDVAFWRKINKIIFDTSVLEEWPSLPQMCEVVIHVACRMQELCSLQPVYNSGQIALNGFALIQFGYSQYVCTSGVEWNQFDLVSIHGTAFTFVLRIT